MPWAGYPGVDMSFAVDKEGVLRINKDPNAVLDYGLDWTEWLGEDIITGSVWEIAPAAELTVGNKSFTNLKTTVWLSGGEAGKSYTVTNRISTSGGRTEDKSFRVTCKER